MKPFAFLALAFFVAGCAHNPSGLSSGSSAALSSSLVTKGASDPQNLPASPEAGKEVKATVTGTVPSKSVESSSDKNEPQEVETVGEETEVSIADPLEPFNRTMFQFNNKMYFWLFKPLALGYKKVVPAPARKGVDNFFTNLGFPIRFVSRLLQADFKGASEELGRFTVNTLWGAGGFLDPSSNQQLNIPKRDADLGQTLGVYGLGQGFYIIWPFVGPSSARDSLGLAVDYYFLDPISYISPWYASMAVRGYGTVNYTSLTIGDYESFLEAAIDPYVAMRDAYIQYRQKMVEAERGKPGPAKPAGVGIIKER
jgi:phospholipid-binding lipoprotein MlaA